MINPCCWRVCREAPGPADDETEDGLGWEPGPGARDTRTTAWIYHPSQGPDPWFPLSDVILGSNSRYQEEEKSLLKIFFDDTAKKLIPSQLFLQSGNLADCVGAVINIKGFLLS